MPTSRISALLASITVKMNKVRFFIDLSLCILFPFTNLIVFLFDSGFNLTVHMFTSRMKVYCVLMI